MSAKKNEVHVDELLNSYETKPKTKDNKAPNQASNDWGEADEGNYVFKIADDQGAGKKTQKKKANTTSTWAAAETAQKDQPKTSDFAKIQEEEAKRKIIKKPGGPKQANIDIGAESFPTLGEERPKQAPKKVEPVPTHAQQTADDGFSVVTGPRKFVNAKKAGTGESFAPLNPDLTEKPVPVAPVREKVQTSQTSQTSEPVVQQTRAPGIFQRSSGTEQQQQPQEAPTDSKFKFGGGEGPRKFIASTGNKISFKREEEKDEHEALRLQKEREMEEKLLREREELAKQREAREARKTDGGERKERTGPRDADGEEKRIARFSNAKKEGDRQNHAPPADKQPVVEEPVDAQPAHAKEVVEMHGALTNKAWGDGPLRKVKK